MTCLGCNAMEDGGKLVTLRSGSVVCAACEDWRHECEARDVLAMPKHERNTYYAEVQKKRGLESVRALIDEVKAQWQARQA